MKQTTPEQMVIKIFFLLIVLVGMSVIGLFLVREVPNNMAKASGCLLLTFTAIIVFALVLKAFKFFFSKPKT